MSSTSNIVRAITMMSIVFATTALQGQAAPRARSNTRGLMIGAQLNRTALTYRDTTNAGLGVGGTIGYGFSPRWQLFFNGDWSKISSSSSLLHTDLGVRYQHASMSRALTPYADLAFTVRTTSIDAGAGTVEVSGRAATIGAGVLYFLTPKLAFDAGLKYSTGKFDSETAGGSTRTISDAETSGTLRIGVGLKIYPQRRR